MPELLLELPMPFRRGGGGELWVESQAANGLRLWAENFDGVTVCAPVLPERLQPEALTSWCLLPSALADRVRLEPLPWGYAVHEHLAQVRGVRQRFRELIGQHQFLIFCNLGGLGAWGTQAADIAAEMHRPYAIWLDWVLHEMHAASARGSLPRRIWRAAQGMLVKRGSLRSVARSSLAMLHGRTVFEAYRGICSHPEIVHDVHIGPEWLISHDRLTQKLAPRHEPVRVRYVGRLHPMKGPTQWLRAMAHLHGSLPSGVSLEATWLGDGPMLDECRAEVDRLGLSGVVAFPGAESDRAKVMEFLYEADLFAFCHLTPESPRCLVEALMAGAPLVGFESAYAADLAASAGGAVLTPVGDTAALAEALGNLVVDHARRQQLSRDAAASGRHFSDVAVFKHRSDLVRQYLGSAVV